MPPGVDLILGLNGLIWVSPHIPRGDDGTPLYDPATGPPPPSPEQRAAAARVANAARALARLYLPLAGPTIQDVYEVRGCVRSAGGGSRSVGVWRR